MSAESAVIDCALGTVIGMVALTVLMSRPIGWIMRRGGRLRNATTIFAGALSIGLGLAVLGRAVISGGATQWFRAQPARDCAQSASPLHMLLVEHVRCAERGELVHVGYSPVQ